MTVIMILRESSKKKKPAYFCEDSLTTISTRVQETGQHIN